MSPTTPQGPYEGCPVQMLNTPRCGRSTYAAPLGVDSIPVCLMHSRHALKDVRKFQEEIDRILFEAGDGEANFSGFVFPATWSFGKWAFRARCVFNRTIFAGPADFFGTCFAQRAIFSEAQFLGEANFIVTDFVGDAVFWAATFARAATFDQTFFRRTANFEFARFLGAVNFRETVFRGDPRQKMGGPCARTMREGGRPDEPEGEEPGPIFKLAYFEYPRLAVFYRTYLGLALFNNCDVSELSFSDVEWRRRKNGKNMVFEEDVSLAHNAAQSVRLAIHNFEARNYRLIAELYQQLKKNYDNRRDYWTAGDFHYGEMEMRRLVTPQPGRVACFLLKRGRWGHWLAGFRQWWHRHMGVAACYRAVSEYGESYIRPVLWLLATLLIFALLYPVVGLHPSIASSGRGSLDGVPATAATLTYVHPCPASNGSHCACLSLSALVGQSIVTSVAVAAFQKDLMYEPDYPLGLLLRIGEMVLASGLTALLLLALRRQFRR